MGVYEASRGTVMPTTARLLRMCFSYDPEGRTYVFNLARVVAFVMITSHRLLRHRSCTSRPAARGAGRVDSMTGANTGPAYTGSYLQDYGGRTGLMAWLTTTDHKRIGLMYMVVMFSFFAVAVLLGLLIRLELMNPGMQFVTPRIYNSLFTLHGVIMIFLFIMPGIPAVFGNFILPLQLGADDVSFPQLNLRQLVHLHGRAP